MTSSTSRSPEPARDLCAELLESFARVKREREAAASPEPAATEPATAAEPATAGEA
jgi:hypothetical protein